MAYSPEENAANSEIIRYDLGWDAINSMLRAGRSLSGHERNCCFLNTRGRRFADISGVAGLDFDDDGRVLALSDWDYDGDVDFWVANRSGPQIRYLQNELDKTQNFLKLRLEGVRSNRDAIGARVVVSYGPSAKTTSQSQTLRAGEGYLAQNSKWLHFGLGSAERAERLEVHWPSGEKQALTDLTANQWYRLREGEPVETWTQPSIAPRLASQFQSPALSDRARIVLLNPIPLSSMPFETETGEQRSVSEPNGQAKLVNLWATWCQPCLEELAVWKQVASEMEQVGVTIVAINADDEAPERRAKADGVWNAIQPPYELGFADKQLVAQFDTLQRSLLSRQRPLPLPSSFLIDGEGRLRVVYKGPVDPATLLADATNLVTAEPAQILAAAVPFRGRWMVPPGGSTPLHLTVKYIDNDLTDTAREYIETLLRQRDRHPEYLSAGITNLYGAILLDAQEFDAAREAFQLSLELDPNDRQAHIELGTLLLRASRGAQAEPHFEHVLQFSSTDPELVYFLGVSRLQQGKLELAREALEQSIRIRPSANAYWQLATAALGLRDAKMAIDSYERALGLAPELAKSANNLAWLLATAEDPSLRNGQRAVELAQQIAQERKDDPSALDTLAAAYAESGDFQQAQDLAEQAITMAKNTGNLQLAEKIQKRVEKYRNDQPHHAPL